MEMVEREIKTLGAMSLELGVSCSQAICRRYLIGGDEALAMAIWADRPLTRPMKES
jgi:hypothetical protein